MAEQQTLLLQVAPGSEMHPAELEQLTQQLIRELQDSGVAVTRVPVTVPAPEGARAAELLAAAAALLITGLSTAASVAQIAEFIQKWQAAHPRSHQVAVSINGSEVPLAADAAMPAQGRRSALLIANSSYQDPALTQLRSPAHDTEALTEVLQRPDIGGFDVATLTDAGESAVRRRVAAFFAGRDPNDLLLIHFSCHGLKDQQGRLFLAAADTELSTLSATAVPAAFIADQMNQSASQRVVLILDCCYSGAFARGAIVRGDRSIHIAEEFGHGSGRIVLTASSATEYAFEGGQLTPYGGQPSVFSGALVTGLQTGDADLDGDGDITIDELYDYTYRQVRQKQSGQEPRKWAFGMAGGLVIARSVRPARLPEAIVSDLASERAVLRLEAIAALGTLRAGTKAGLRDVATSELIRLRDHDDSLRVRDAASEVLATRPGSNMDRRLPPTSTPSDGDGQKTPPARPAHDPPPPTGGGVPARLSWWRHRRKLITLAAAITVTAVAAVFMWANLLSGNRNTPSSGPSAPAALTIGFYGDLGGEQRSYLQSARNAAGLALAEYTPAPNTPKVELVSFGSNWTAEVAGQTSRKIVGVIGPYNSTLTASSAPVLESFGIPSITVSASLDDFRNRGWKYWHRLIADDYEQLSQLAGYLSRIYKPRNAYTIDYGAGDTADFAGRFATMLKQKGATEVTQDRIQPGGADIAEIVQRIKEYRPDVIVQFGSSADAAETLKQLHNAGITAPFASAENVLLDPDILRAEGCLIATSFLLPTPESGPAVQSFIQRYKQRYGAEPGPYALEAYDAASAFLKAIQAGNHTPKDINNYLATTAFTGLSRSIQFRSDGENSALPVYIFQIKNGQPALIGNATTAS